MNFGDSFSVHGIGFVRSELKDRADAPKQGEEGAPDAWLEIRPEFLAGLQGIREGDALLVFTWLHQGDRDVLQVHPRGDPANPLTGVFATRSPSRPNPIGLHRVTVRAVESGRLRVGPLEAIDGTPVIDLKPVWLADEATARFVSQEAAEGTEQGSLGSRCYLLYKGFGLGKASASEADFAAVLRTVGSGELADRLNNVAELLVVIADAGVQFCEFFRESFMVEEQFAHANEGANHEDTHTCRFRSVEDICSHNGPGFGEGIGAEAPSSASFV